MNPFVQRMNRERKPMKQKRLGDINIGDMIMTIRGPEPVTEIIHRTNRTMFRVTFEDGRELRMSEDHPIHVEGKGYAALNNSFDYKDLGKAELLEVGDHVTNEDGSSTKIISIEPDAYREDVFTFANSGYYANGFLVY